MVSNSRHHLNLLGIQWVKMRLRYRASFCHKPLISALRKKSHSKLSSNSAKAVHYAHEDNIDFL